MMLLRPLAVAALTTAVALSPSLHFQAPAYADAPRPGLLRRISNAYGAQVTFTYRTAADIEAAQVTDPTHPWTALGRWSRHVPGPLVLVTGVESTDGAPSPY